MARNTELITLYKDGVTLRGTNRKTTVVHKVGKGKKKGQQANALQFKALTALEGVGKEPGVFHALSDNEKIKYTEIRLSDHAIIELYVTLGHYLEHVLKPKLEKETKLK